MNGIWLAAALAGASTAVLVALPQPGSLRFRDLSTTPRRLPPRVAWRPLVLVVPVALVLGPAAAVLAGGAVVLTDRVLRARSARRAAATEQARAMEACGVLASELRAGRDPAEALAAAAAAAAGPSAAALAAAAAAGRLGGDVPAALVSSTGSAVAPELRALAACWTVCASSGSGLASSVARLEEGLRAERARRRAVDAELAGPRATAGLLAVLPAVGLLMAAGLGADPLHVLLGTPLGLVCLVLGLGLDALGVLWTGRLVRRVGAP